MAKLKQIAIKVSKKLGSAKKSKKSKEVKPDSLEVFGGAVPKKAKNQVIDRLGYKLYILKGEDESTITELQNSGRTIGVIRFDNPQLSPNEDEVIICVRD